MGTPILRHRVRASLVQFTILLIVMLVACETDPNGPGGTILGHLQIQPVLESSVDPARLGLDEIHVTIMREFDSTVIVDTTVAYDPTEDDVFGWVLDLDVPSEMMIVRAEVLRAGVPMFAAESTLVVDETVIGESEVRTVNLPFIGPGWNIVSLEIDPGDSLVSHSDLAQFRAAAIDDSGEAVTDFVVVWETTDPTIATIDSDAVLQAPATGRTSVQVIATTPTGVADSANVRFLPLPGSLASILGDGDSVQVNTELPLQVQVLGTDGIGIEQATVLFTAPEGAGVADAQVVTGPDGFAGTIGTVGILAGAYEFAATVEGVPEATLSVVAIAGPAVALQFTRIPEEVSVSVDIQPAVEVAVVDGFGNVVLTADNSVTLSLEPNALEAVLIGTTSEQATDGAARFADLRVDTRGNAFRMLAAADGLTGAVSLPFDVTQSVETIEIDPTEASFAALGDTVRLLATAFDGAETLVSDARIHWSSSNSAAATVDDEGLVRAVGNGSAVITAASGNASSTVGVFVAQEAALVVISPRDVELLERNATEQLVVTVFDANDNPIEGAEVVWASSDVGVAGVNQSGLVIANGDGSATISATSGESSDEISVSVFATPVGAIVVSPEISHLNAVEAMASLSAEALDGDGAPIAGVVFDWSSSDENIATVDENGNVIARANGSVAIFAAYRDKVGSALVEVSQVAATVEITPSRIQLGAIGATTQLNASVSDENGYTIAGAEVMWSSSNEAVATVDETTGEVVAVAGGTTTITATSGEVADIAQLTVSQEVVSITVTPPTATLVSLNESVDLIATAWDAGGNRVTGVEFEWVSSAAGVATAGETDGSVVAESNGTANIVATADGVSGSAFVTVAQEADSIAITPDSARMVSLGDSVDFNASAWDAGGSELVDPEFNWVTSVNAVATIVSSGVVEAVSDGLATISVSVDDVSVSAAVTVEQEVSSVTVTPEAATLAAFGESADLVATAWDAGGSEVVGVMFDWGSSVDSVATVTATGRVSAVSNGSSTITATTTAGGISAGAEVRVLQEIASVAITPTAADLVSFGETVQFAAAAFDAGGNEVENADFNWTSSVEGVATVGLSTGSVTAVTDGATIVTATVGGLSGSVDVTVSQRVASVLVSPTSASFVSLGESTDFDATALDARGNAVVGAAFRWESSADGVATVGPTGLVAVIADGNTSITAITGEASGSAEVTVSQQVASVTMTSPNVNLVSIGESSNFTATAFDAGGHEVNDAVFTWESSVDTVASVGTAGTVVAESNGSTTITATSGGASASAGVSVAQQAVSITVTPSATTLVSIAASDTLSATAWDERGNAVAGVVFSWESSVQGIATVGTDNGIVSAVSNGLVTVTAAFDTLQGSATVNVSQELASITVTPPTSNLASFGDVVDLNAFAWDAGGSPIDTTFTWSSSPGGFATVGSDGLVTALLNGVATITAMVGDSSGAASVTVLQVPDSVAVSPPSANMVSLGDQVDFTATAWDAGGSQIVGAEFSWVSSAVGIATVGTSGIASAVSNGEATIAASIGDASGSADVTVAQEVVSVTVTPPTSTLVSFGEAVGMAATAWDSSGSEVDTTFTWGSSASGIAMVNSLGLVSAVSDGQATITASVGAESGTAGVTVSQQPATVEVSPGAVWFGALGETEQLAVTVRDALANVMTDAVVTWGITADSAVVTVHADTGLVTAVGNGDALVVATSGSVSGSVSATVQQVAASVNVSPSAVGFDAIGDTETLTATVYDTRGNEIPDASVVWSVSGNAGIASVGSETGVVEALGDGGVTIIATSGAVFGNGTATVAQVAASVDITPSTATLLAIGATQQLAATVRDANGYAMSDTGVTWTACPEPPAPEGGPARGVGVPCAVSVTQAGLVTALSEGVSTVSATYGALVGTAQITVSLSLSSAHLPSNNSDGNDGEAANPVLTDDNILVGDETAFLKK